MNEVYLLLGSNEGAREENIETARQFIAFRCGEIVARSSLYETEAWGIKEQNSFLNQAVAVITGLEPSQLLKTLKSIESQTGRTETVKWGPRVIDIDILFYENEIIDTPELKIPHPYIQDRRFTLIPLNEIASAFIHPVLKKTIGELLEECSDKSAVKKFE